MMFVGALPKRVSSTAPTILATSTAGPIIRFVFRHPNAGIRAIMPVNNQIFPGYSILKIL
jgi:hypothetical protein